VVDGSGGPARRADVGIAKGRVVEVGRIEARGTREISAEGAIVAPGFVDIHTHYDGQVTWGTSLAPSSWHGVTTVVMGNCGVGFAPVRKADRGRLIELMEGVEDIPGTALHEGLPWAWETFGEYLDFLDGRSWDIDVATQLPHAPLRVYVMGERCTAENPATAEDVSAMASLAREALEAGALGFTTSRTLNHRSIAGEFTPTLRAETEELVGIARGLRTAGRGVLQCVSDFVVEGIVDTDAEFALLYRMAQESNRPLSVSIAQAPGASRKFRTLLDRLAAACDEGVQMRAQVATRAIGLLLGFDGTLHPFLNSPTYQELASLPLAERVRELRRPEVRDRILHERRMVPATILGAGRISDFDSMFPLADPPVYEPDPADSVGARARRERRSPQEVAYDLLLERDGQAFLYLPAGNWADQNLDNVREQLLHRVAIPGLSDGGAHVGTICDASFPSTLLQWWGRERPEGRIPLETLVAKQARMTAEAVGLLDRGVLAPGYLADINIIDLDRLTVRAPTMVQDLPAGGRRLMQSVEGYRHTIKSGIEIMADGNSTGALPGRLVRGEQCATAGRGSTS
jgi:N-acyl-D-aspartate/D-glutamate deacylase